MSPDDPQTLTELRVDTSNLYREETYTDMRVASIRMLVPVKLDGSPDPTREPLFSGQTTLMSAAGPLPVQCPLEARTLAEAAERFPTAIRDAVERLVEEARELQRRESSRIVMPGEVPIPGPLRGPGSGSGGFGIS